MKDLLILLIIIISYILGYIFGRLDQENKNRDEYLKTRDNHE